GRGTSIKVYLPRTDDEPSEDSAGPVAPLPVGSGHILVVEDDDQVRAGVVEQLLGLGYRGDETSTGAAGLAAFQAKRGRYDLLLTDVVMPGPVGGRELADEVGRRWPGTPVIFMSGYTEDAIIHHGRLDVGVRLLAKPFRKRDLAEMVHRALANASKAK